MPIIGKIRSQVEIFLERVILREQYKKIEALDAKLEYALLEISRLRSLCRYLSAGKVQVMPMVRQTRDSFDYQWTDVSPDAHGVESSSETKQEVAQRVLESTQLDRDWFQHKKILDAGCGAGRFTYALASLGAEIVAIDQSANGVKQAERICSEYMDRIQIFQHDLTTPINLNPEFDLVWSHGVLHHTGDTYGAFQNVARLVKPGGYMYMMIYAEPDKDLGAYLYYSEIENLRRQTINKSFQEKWDYIHGLKEVNPVDWFDAISPVINDTYSYYELEAWLLDAGFEDIKRTLDVPNHNIIARKTA